MNPLKHVAIIMDGNGRWGLKKKKSRKGNKDVQLFWVKTKHKWKRTKYRKIKNDLEVGEIK